MDEQNCLPEFRSPEWYREAGKAGMKSEDAELRQRGLQDIIRAQVLGDPEAGYMVADMLLRGVLVPVEGNGEERALEILREAAGKGGVQARALLNAHCFRRYREKAEPGERAPGPLVDFAGEPIKIDRTGILTPVDAVLTYENGVNHLALSANIRFLATWDLENPEAFENAVLEGLRLWQGEYRVFGNQRLRVTVSLTTEKRLYDNVFVIPISNQMGDDLRMYSERLIKKESQRERVSSMLRQKRSFATLGLRKWSVSSRKFIYMQSPTGRFDDYRELMHVAKHEFGHALGLGDLYEDEGDGLPGVEKGSYPELDGFHLSGRFYNLVMCDHHGPISNNDMEMVVLAFWENKAQLFQPEAGQGRVSRALGQGN